MDAANTTGPITWTFTSSPITEAKVYIDPRTLKPCKHRWTPDIAEGTASWTITPRCAKCGKIGSPADKGVNLARLVKQLG